jgi:hypothetical protein
MMTQNYFLKLKKAYQNDQVLPNTRKTVYFPIFL